MRGSRAWALTGTILMVALLHSPAKAAEGGGQIARSAIRGHFGSLEASPDVVVQRGQRNYAGPRCPGPDWNCTKARNVLQIATEGGQNRFDCRANRCSVIQQFSAGSGANNASCIQRKQENRRRQRASLACVIAQTNGTGVNAASVSQFIVQKTKMSPQDSTELADVFQVNRSGNNKAEIDQRVEQDAETKKQEAEQFQDSYQNAAVNQEATTGTNLEELEQLLVQDAVIEGDVPGGSLSQFQYAALQGNVRQASEGISKSFNRQGAFQTMDAPRGTSQVQDPRGRCCTSQTGNVNNVFTIDQRFVQLASNPSGQLGYEVGECFTSGICTITQRARQNDERATNSASDSGFVTATIICERLRRTNRCTSERFEDLD
jgi:hypothetical protein